MKFQWEENLVLGITQIDKEHMELVQQANKLFDALGDPDKSSKEILETLNFLAGYVVNHFNSEEKLQLKYGYPMFNQHKRIHEDFKKEVATLIHDIEINGLKTSQKLSINKMVIHWLKNHIGVEDRKVAEYIKSKQ
ncbi:MAG: hemerythrin family protein [Clostridia bacterium]|nr:hemerythrin family protein [Clostridia bacterium]